MSRLLTTLCVLTTATLLPLAVPVRAVGAPAVSPPADAAPAHPAAAKSVEPEWEMRRYVLGLLYRGEKWTAEKTPETEQLQAGHMAHIGRMAESGKLLLAGPFLDATDLRGIFLFKMESVEEAQALCDQDPAVNAGRLRVELHPWYGAANIIVLPKAPAAAPAPAAK